jgi:hypothetical integral membrane protein (TIGR02206 family)
MLDYFTKDWKGEPFQLFGTAHLIGLAVILLVELFLIFGWKNPSPRARRAFRYALAAILVANESLWHWWNWYIGQWSIQYMLPLHICSVLVWVCAWVLFTGNYAVYDYVYFLGIGAASQALFTPDAGPYGFPHFRFWQVLISHGAIVTTAIYLTAIEGLRPTWKSFAKVAIGTNVYLAAIMIVNALIGSNYMFVAHKPETASLIDLMPDWPWYILVLEAIGAVVFLILYAPFAIKDRRARAQTAR